MLISINQLEFCYQAEQPILSIADFSLGQAESCFIKGASGSGKSTLLALLAGFLTPQQGDISILDKRLNQLSSTKRDRFRADHIGFVFQQFNLLPFLSVSENVVVPCHFSAQRRQRAISLDGSVFDSARRLLRELDIPVHLINESVQKLSVGQQQRVAVARALIGSPELIIADEPTSSLDQDAKSAFLQLLIKEQKQAGAGLLFVSHDPELTDFFDKKVVLSEINQAGNGKES